MIRPVRGLLLSRGDGVDTLLVSSMSEGVIVRTVLVCVRSSQAAQSIAACVARLGASSVWTASSEPEVMAKLAERPAELVLADTAVSRPDPVAFTRRVLALSPRATLILIGPEEAPVAAATVAAGARGLIRGDTDPVTTVVKALLLVGSPRRARDLPAAPPRPAGAPSSALPSSPVSPAPVTAVVTRAAPHPAAPVPAQRVDAGAGSGPARRVRLTERELQVLKGMAAGQSNGEIGRELYVSEDTVKTHARRLFRKLGVRDRAHAVAVGFRTGALD